MPYSELKPGRLRLEDESTGNARLLIQDNDELKYADGAGTLIQLLSNIKSGTKAARPSASLKGRIYFATDTGEWFYDDGSNWHRIACGGDYIGDADLDTKFETERSADEDIIRAKAGGQDIFEGYSSGIFSLKNQSAVYVTLSADQTIASGTTTKLAFDNVGYDNQSEFNTTNHRFTATKDGIYLVCLSILTANVAWSAGNYVVLYVYKNGSEFVKAAEKVDASVTRDINLILVAPVKLVGSDYFDFYVRHDRGSDTDISSNSKYTYVRIVKIV